MDQYVFVRLRAREGEENAVEEALREVTGPSREEAGCLSFHTFRSMRDGGSFTFIRGGWTKPHSRPTPNCRIPFVSSSAWIPCSISPALSRGRK